MFSAVCSSQHGLAAVRLLLLGAALHCVCLGGCVSGHRRTMTQFLPSVPQTWWPGIREEPDEETTSAEPSVTANVAAIDDTTESPVNEGKAYVSETPTNSKRERGGRTSASSGSVTAQTGGRVALNSSASQQRSAVRDVADAATINQAGGDGGQDQLERLKAALTEDAKRNTEPSLSTGVSGDARLRVDSLLSRARRLFDVGQFTEARHTAQIARELGDTAQLDYTPDEERPIDLVHRIDDQLQAMEQPLDETDNSSVVDADRSKNEEQPSVEPKANATESPGNRPWLLGRGMNVFRRDRKPAAADAVIIPAAVDNTPPLVSLSLELEGNTNPGTDSRTAVVQANRSVALSTVTSPPKVSREAIQFRAVDRSEAEGHLRSSQSVDEADTYEPELPGDSPRATVTESPDESLVETANFSPDDGPRLSADNTSSPPPTLEDVRPVSPFRNVASQAKPAHPSSSELIEPRGSLWSWASGAVCISACSVLALACYRRGAT